MFTICAVEQPTIGDDKWATHLHAKITCIQRQLRGTMVGVTRVSKDMSFSTRAAVTNQLFGHADEGFGNIENVLRVRL